MPSPPPSPGTPRAKRVPKPSDLCTPRSYSRPSEQERGVRRWLLSEVFCTSEPRAPLAFSCWTEPHVVLGTVRSSHKTARRGSCGLPIVVREDEPVEGQAVALRSRRACARTHPAQGSAPLPRGLLRTSPPSQRLAVTSDGFVYVRPYYGSERICRPLPMVDSARTCDAMREDLWRSLRLGAFHRHLPYCASAWGPRSGARPHGGNVGRGPAQHAFSDFVQKISKGSVFDPFRLPFEKDGLVSSFTALYWMT